MPSPRTSRYRLLVSGRLPTTLADLVADRFGSSAVIIAEPSGTVVDVHADQAGLQALLTLLWDVGQEVQSLSRYGDLPQRAEG